MKDTIEKLQDRIDVKSLLYICEQHTNDTFKLKNNLRTKEVRLVAFKKQFEKYSDLKYNIESSLSLIALNLENITPNKEIADNNVRINYRNKLLKLFIYC